MADREVVWEGSVDVTDEAPLPHTLRIIPGETVTEAIQIRVIAAQSGTPLWEALRETRFVAGEEVEERVCLFRSCARSRAASCLSGLCEHAGDGDADADADGDGDTDADGDADTDTDADGAADALADGDLDAGNDAIRRYWP